MELIGQTIGGFRIVEEIGRGGMAIVYKARQDTLGRYVALKVLPPYYQHDGEFLARFQQEAQSAARLNHPNIVKIYDAAQQDGFSYIAMEYIEGQSLDRHLAQHQGALDLSTATRIVAQIASALDYAHQAGIVHRDVKPSNILLDKEGRAVLMDFGIARASEARRLTMTGALVGTPEYMSPEQVEGKTVDARSDIYSLGLVAYHLLAGRAPFTATQPQAILYAQVHRQPPSLTQLNPSLPASVEQVVLRALAKDPKARYPAAGDFARALQQAAAEQRVAGAPRFPARQPPWVWIGAGLALLIVLILVASSLLGGRPTPTPIPTATSVGQVTSTPGRNATPTSAARTQTPTPQSGSPGPSGTAVADAPPEVAILSPRNGARCEVGDVVGIDLQALDDVGLDAVRLSVDGRLYAEESLQGQRAATHRFLWQPQSAGDHDLEVIVVDINGQASSVARVIISVLEAATATWTPTPTPSLTPTITPVLPAVACDFDRTTCRWEWVYDPTGARYTFSGGQLNFEVTRADTVRQILLQGQTFRDFTAVVRVRQHSGHASGVYGLVFRHRDHRNSYQFTINGTGQFEVGGEFNNVWQYLRNYRGEQTSSALNRSGSWNTLKIVCSGSRIQVYVNGTQVVDAIDSTFSSGQVGLVVGTTTSGRDLGVYFDDFEVYVP